MHCRGRRGRGYISATPSPNKGLSLPIKRTMSQQTSNSPTVAAECERFDYYLSSFHDRMMIEAETELQQNWTSVALHDKYALSCVPEDHVFVWVLKPEGSHFLETFCRLDAREYHIQAAERNKLSAFEAFFIRCQDCFCKFRNKYDPTKYKYYVMINKNEPYGGEMIPSTFEEMLDLSFAQQLKWTDCGMQPTGKTCNAWECNWLELEA